MRRQILSLFLTLLILSVGGALSMVGAASHMAPGQGLKPTVEEAGYATGDVVYSSPTFA